MTSRNPNPAKRRLVDMSEALPRFEYSPPTCEHLDRRDWFVNVAEGHRLEVRTTSHHRNGLIVDFAIMQIHEAPQDIQIARIDCCHGVCHRHVFDQDGTDMMKSKVIERIPEKDSWQRVDALYSECNDKMFAEWAENYRRWEQSA